MQTMRAMMVVVGLGFLLAACSSAPGEGVGGVSTGSAAPSSTGTGPSGDGDCHAFCQVLTKADCPMPLSESDCEAGCAMVLALCPSDTAAANACGIASGKSDCDQYGYPCAFG
jgi:hypothetical protein